MPQKDGRVSEHSERGITIASDQLMPTDHIIRYWMVFVVFTGGREDRDDLELLVCNISNIYVTIC